MKKLIILLLFISLLSFSQNHNADIIIYGGTSSGIAAAIESSEDLTSNLLILARLVFIYFKINMLYRAN